MLKKLGFTLIVLALLVIPSLSPTTVAAVIESEIIDHGVLKNDRMLIPLRAVSQSMGADVKWNQLDKSVRIKKSNNEIILVVNFKRGIVNNKKIDFDAPVELINSTTYVPLRFVSEALGADVKWNQQTKQATFILDDKNVTVKVKQPAHLPNRISEVRLKTLSERINQIGDLSGVNIRNTFKPYLTDGFLNSLMKSNGTGYVHEFDDPETKPNYISKSTANFMQSLVMGNTLEGDRHYVLDRQVTLVNVQGIWKVDKVTYAIRDIPYLALEN